MPIQTRIIDWTKEKDLPICPKCGKHGVERTYKAGDRAFNHEGKEIWIPVLGSGLEITKSCFVKKS